MVNPYGVNLWKEALKYAFDPRLKTTISEWQPFTSQPDFFVTIILGISLPFLFRYFKKFNYFEVGLFIILVVSVLSSIRNIPLLGIYLVYFLSLSLDFMWKEFSANKLTLSRFKKTVSMLLTGMIIGLILQSTLTTIKFTAYSESNFYPQAAINFLAKNPQTGQLFSNYGWGGYLIWKLPQYGVFIDGRMPSWRQTTKDKNQSSDAFGEYLSITQGKTNFKDTATKYNIKLVLWPNPQNQNKDLLSNIRKFINSFNLLFYPQISEFNFNQNLENLGWKIIYQDNIAIIYQSPN